MEPKGQPDARASVDVSTIRERFNYGWAMDSDNGVEQDTYWWWACSVRVDPDEVIADDDEGGLWSIPFTTDGADTVTFGTPVRVRETFVPVEAADGVAATAAVKRRRQRVAASDLERPEKPALNNQAASRPRQEDAAMGIDIATLRSRTGLSETELPDDATEEQINEALAKEPAAAAPEGEPAGEDEQAAETAPAEAPEAEPVAASDRTVTVDRDAWERTQRDAEAGAAARRAQLSAELDREADDAVKDGRITPASRAGWRGAIDPGENPDAAASARATAEKKALASLAAGRVPVDEPRGKGAATSVEDDGLLAATRASLGIPKPTKED